MWVLLRSKASGEREAALPSQEAGLSRKITERCQANESSASPRMRFPFGSMVRRQIGSPDDSGQAVKLLARMIIDDNLSPFVVPGSNDDRRSESAMKLLFNVQDMRGLVVGIVRGLFADPGASESRLPRGYESLGLSD